MYRYVTRPEAPMDDGSPTGEVFVYQQKMIGRDPLTGIDEWIDTEFSPQGPMDPELARKLWSIDRRI